MLLVLTTAPAPMAVAFVRLPEPTSARLPKSVLLLPVVLLCPVLAPKKELLSPVELKAAYPPKNELLLPIVL